MDHLSSIMNGNLISILNQPWAPEAKVANYVELYQTMHHFLSDIPFLIVFILISFVFGTKESFY